MTLDVSWTFACFIQLEKRCQTKSVQAARRVSTHEWGHDASNIADAQLHSNSGGSFAISWQVWSESVGIPLTLCFTLQGLT